MKRQFIFIIICWILLLDQALADTSIIYKETRIPMVDAGTHGLETLLVWPNDALRHPTVLINHGSPRDPKKRIEMSAIASLPIAMEFARRGFAVAVVMRRGYGTSGGGWAEGLGSCSAPNYLSSASAASKDLHTIIAYLNTLPQFDTNKIVAVGVSAGGFSTVALTADHPPQGLVAAISFAGGRGSKASNIVCKADQLVDTFGTFGKTSRTPMLWVYAENDHFFNPDLAKRMYAAFTKNGGKAIFTMTVPYGEEGHFLFSNAGISTWTPIVDDFLKTQHLVFVKKLLPLPAAPDLKTPTNLSVQGQHDFENYMKGAPHKAFAVSSKGAYGWRTGQRTIDEAKNQAMTNCKKYTSEKCQIIAVDNEMTSHNL
jgi:dienelactone hydrolase